MNIRRAVEDTRRQTDVRDSRAGQKHTAVDHLRRLITTLTGVRMGLKRVPAVELLESDTDAGLGLQTGDVTLPLTSPER
jgi:hypothetical protein